MAIKLERGVGLGLNGPAIRRRTFFAASLTGIYEDLLGKSVDVVALLLLKMLLILLSSFVTSSS